MKQELNYHRVILCVMVVMTHLLTQYSINTNPDDNQIQVLYWIRNIFIVATPGFIILSEMLTAMNYKERLPKGYLWQRMKYILVPYFAVGLFYSFTESIYNEAGVWEIFSNSILLVNWYGYFIIVIMQFFVLNVIIYKINPVILKSKMMLVLSFIINFGFLYSYYNTDFVWNAVNDIYPLGDTTFIFGWIFFYFFGAFLGMHYEAVKVFVEQQAALIILMVLISYGIFIVLSRDDFYTVTSFDYALILYHMASFLMILYISTQFVGVTNELVTIISTFSFFIYLFHPLILPGIYTVTEAFADMTIIFLLLSMLLVIGTCIGVGLILKQFDLFKFVIGRQPYKIKLL